MADDEFQPPSFSLGFDLDLHGDTQRECHWNPVTKSADTASEAASFEEDDDADIVSSGWNPVSPRNYKRLRRGDGKRLATEVGKKETEDSKRDQDDEDDIEDFSDDDWPRGFPLSNSLCSSSKPSLHRSRVMVSDCRTKSNLRKGKEVSSVSTSMNMERNGNMAIPKFTASPLRKFQLIDSDSEDPSVIEGQNTEVPRVIFPRQNQQSDNNHSLLSNHISKITSSSECQNQDLWKGFGLDKSSHIPTPAFDEVCNEYFRNAKDKINVKSDYKDLNNGMISGSAPAHCYFFHKDSRIQQLVRDRLPYFFPLRACYNPEHEQSNEAEIDYMAQFVHHDNSKQSNQMQNVEKSTTINKKNGKISQLNNSQDPENWVNPKDSAGSTRNASNRRVQAVGKSSGHWYTSSDGKRVYVNKNGQESAGRNAYKQYRLESGSGFKKSKRKTASNKRTAAKKSAPRKK